MKNVCLFYGGFVISCSYSIPIKNLDAYSKAYLLKYNYGEVYHCPIPTDEGESICYYHNEKRVRDDVDQGIIKQFKELPQPENDALDAEGNRSSPYVFIHCFFPALKFPENNAENPVEDLTFIGCHFLGLINASSCHFRAFIGYKAQFQQKVDFSEAQFQQTDFSQAQFQQEADFSLAHFQQKAYFFRAHFQQKTNFSLAQFQQEAYFGQAQFQQEADFTYAQFQKTDFGKSAFRGQTNFSFSTFKKGVSFLQTQFHTITIFDSVTFHSDASFKETVFIQDYNSKKSDKTSMARFKPNCFISFHNCTFLEPKLTNFDDISFKYVSFVGTDVSQIRFGQIHWHRHKNKIQLFDERLIKVRDMHLPLDTSSETEKFNFLPENINEALMVYRRFRESLEYDMDYSQAGELYYQEMELKRWAALHRRQDMQWNRFRAISEWTIGGFYKYSSEYGENILRAILSMVVLVGVFAGLATWIQVAYWQEILSFTLFEQQFAHSVALFFQVGEISQTTFYVDVIERITSILVLGTVFISLRRQYERRIRG